MGTHPGGRSGLEDAEPHSLGSCFQRRRNGERRKLVRSFHWVWPGIILYVRGVRVGRILQFRGCFLEGAGSATKRSLPWRHPHSCQEKQLLGFPSKKGNFSPGGRGDRARCYRKQELPGRFSCGGRGDDGLGSNASSLASWLCDPGQVISPL